MAGANYNLRNRVRAGDKSEVATQAGGKGSDALPTPTVTDIEAPATSWVNAHQLLVLAVLLLPNVYGIMYPEQSGFADFWSVFAKGNLAFSLRTLTTPIFWIPVIGSSFERITYSYIWTHSQQFAGFCERNKLGDPMQLVHRSFYFFKASQTISMGIWYSAVTGSIWALPSHLASMSPYQLAMGLALGGAGQAFNIGIYNAIGVAGVYYGCRLGHDVPWATGFPFTVLSHAQYTGVICTIFAAVIMTSTEAHFEAGATLIASLISAMYVFTMYVESRL